MLPIPWRLRCGAASTSNRIASPPMCLEGRKSELVESRFGIKGLRYRFGAVARFFWFQFTRIKFASRPTGQRLQSLQDRVLPARSWLQDSDDLGQFKSHRTGQWHQICLWTATADNWAKFIQFPFGPRTAAPKNAKRLLRFGSTKGLEPQIFITSRKFQLAKRKK